MPKDLLILYSSTGILLLLIGILACVDRVPDIENAVRDVSQNVVEAENQPLIRTTVSGRNVEFRGVASTVQAREGIVQEMRSSPAVGGFDEHIVVGHGDLISFQRHGRSLHVKGVMPDYRTRDALITYARDVFGRRRVVDRTIVDGREIDYAWPNIVRSMIDMSHVEGVLSLSFSDRLVNLVVEDAGSVPAELMVEMPVGYDMAIKQASEGTSLNAAQCQTEINSILARNPLQFSSGKADIDLQSNELALVRLGQALGRCTGYDFIIAGHTDASGSEPSNVRLSSERAEAVLAALVRRGLDENRISAVGKGSSQPVADNETVEGKAANRRIEIQVLDK